MKNSIREIRKKRGITLTELAKKLNMGKGNLSQIETGKLSLTQQNLNKLSEILKVTSSEILGEKPLANEQLVKIKYIDDIFDFKECSDVDNANSFMFDISFLSYAGIREKFKNILIVKAPNNSMYPLIEKNDLIFIDIANREIEKDGLYLIKEQGSMQIRKAVIHKENEKIAISMLNRQLIGNVEKNYTHEELKDCVCGSVIFHIKYAF